MKRNGFTLVELLAVIIILAVIALIAFPATLESIESSKEKLYKEQVQRILDAADSWASENDYLLPNNSAGSTPITITVRQLQREGLLKKESVKNPMDSADDMTDSNVVIYYDSEYKQYVSGYCEDDEEYAQIFYPNSSEYADIIAKCNSATPVSIS